MAGKPLWRKAFDLVERAAAPRLEGLVQTAGFADVVAVGVKLDAGMRRRLERQTRRLWHAANLPAGSDITRLRDQVVSLDRQLRLVITALEDAQKESHDAQSPAPPNTARRGGSGPTRGRTQRATRS